MHINRRFLLSMNIKILVATHKAYRMPEDSMYFPIHVGKEGKDFDLGYQGDNTGENISNKNTTFCELTGIYWAYQNLSADYIGLVHYRRHFCLHKTRDKFAGVMTFDEAKELLSQYPILLPKQRNYFIETNYSHYVHAHHAEGIDMLREIIERDYPEYAPACRTVMNRTHAHMFNMFVMRNDYFHEYCDWMFPILFKIEKNLDISDYSVYEARVFGFLAERMLDIWLEKNKYSYKEIPVRFMESQNWFKKGFLFLKRKFVKSTPYQ